MELQAAIAIATSYYQEHGGMTITKVYDANEIWIIFAQKDGKVRFGSNGISIDKNTGAIKTFRLPSKENFEILDSATLINI